MPRIKRLQLPLWASSTSTRTNSRHRLKGLKTGAASPAELPELRAAHGGSLARGRRKEKRPLSFKRPMHLVLRSDKARGAWNLLRHERSVDALLRRQARRHHVKIQHYVNAGNHLHIKLRVYSRESFGAFLKSFSALLSRRVTGARRGRGLLRAEAKRQTGLACAPTAKFWDGLAFTRILYHSIEEKFLARYFTANSLEARFGVGVREIFLGRGELARSLGYG